MELAATNKHRATCNSIKPTWTAAYAIDRGVTLLFRLTFDATLRRVRLLLDKVLCDLAGGMFSTPSSSSEMSLAEEGDVNIVL
jgi:hypothetical protein